MFPAQFHDLADPRITRSGHFLRLCRLDELPQLFNILKGDMSWLAPGPRRPRSKRDNVPRYRVLRPAGHRASGYHRLGSRSTKANAYEADAMRSKLEYDLYYLKHCSLWLDLVIVLRHSPWCSMAPGAR